LGLTRTGSSEAVHQLKNFCAFASIRSLIYAAEGSQFVDVTKKQVSTVFYFAACCTALGRDQDEKNIAVLRRQSASGGGQK
jgi:hypothetical protein